MRKNVDEGIEAIKQQHAQDLARLKSSLDAIQFERQTRFANTHQKRAEVIANLFALIAEAHHKLGAMVAPLQMGFADKDTEDKRKSEQWRLAAEALNAMTDAYRKNRIYLGGKATAKTDEVIRLLHDACIDFDTVRGEMDREAGKMRVQAWKTISDKVPTALAELEIEFHSILGMAD